MPIPSQQDTAQRLTAKERVFNTIQQWIIYGTLLPGERLNDVELAKYFNVSRTPVREAIQLLCEKGLVTIVPSSGTYVSKIDLNDMSQAYHLLASLQSLAVTGLVSPLSEEVIKELTGLNELFYKYAKSGRTAEAMETDGIFHHRIAELSGNRYITRFTDELIIQAHRNEFQFFKKGYHTEESYETHKKIINALSDCDVQTASELLRSNWNISLK